jgi:hypothetical protein
MTKMDGRKKNMSATTADRVIILNMIASLSEASKPPRRA